MEARVESATRRRALTLGEELTALLSDPEGTVHRLQTVRAEQKEVSTGSLLRGIVDVDLAVGTDSFAGFQLGSKMTTCDRIEGKRVSFVQSL